MSALGKELWVVLAVFAPVFLWTTAIVQNADRTLLVFPALEVLVFAAGSIIIWRRGKIGSIEEQLGVLGRLAYFPIGRALLKCPSCSHVNRAYVRFCTRCGHNFGGLQLAQ